MDRLKQISREKLERDSDLSSLQKRIQELERTNYDLNLTIDR